MTTHADPPAGDVVQNPSFDPHPGRMVIDVSKGPVLPRSTASPSEFSDLDRFMSDTPPEPDLEQAREGLPEGLVQIGGMVVPKAVLDGARMVPDASTAGSDFASSDGARPQADGDTPNWGPEDCAYPDEVPPGVYSYPPKPGMERPRFGTVFMNYNGGVLYTKHPENPDLVGGENSAENISTIARSGHTFPPYAGGEARAIAVAQAVQVDLEDWAIRVVYLERPPKILPYTMVMMGGHWSDTTAGSSGGVAPLDCEDIGQRNVCYAFQNQQPATTQANVASQEIGHTYGLGHTRAPDSVMAFGYAPTQGGDLGFNDACTEIVQVAGQGSACIGTNRCHCGDPSYQHDKQTLSFIFAPAGVDLIEPTIEVLSPADGQVFEVGEPVEVEVDPWDDVGGFGWKFVLETEDGEVLVDQVDYLRTMGITFVGLPPGNYVVRGEIQDHADHVGTHEITIEVRESGQDEEGGDTDSGDSASDSGSDSGGTSNGAGDDVADDDESSGSDTAGQLDDDGCGCATPRETPWPGAGLLALVLAGLRRRRLT